MSHAKELQSSYKKLSKIMYIFIINEKEKTPKGSYNSSEMVFWPFFWR